MKVYRYMSEKEFHACNSGIELVPLHRNHKARTTSKGFCFLPEIVCLHGQHYDGTPYTEKTTADHCLSFLSGIVTSDVLVEFEAPETFFRKSDGIYADPYSDSWDDFITMDELCCDSYSRDILIPLRYAVFQKGEAVWYEYH